ncbi:hypothetical protein EYF80_013762 [Liparis tanakae]|uniref:Uncharacterized protein n=1 Tax=Liparis tanakae TaxID=230148 RepID=A0A4Z2ID42_9TELE|nr:hypothetical protein EYF80_013762 [Liparis tanakae]
MESVRSGVDGSPVAHSGIWTWFRVQNIQHEVRGKVVREPGRQTGTREGALERTYCCLYLLCLFLFLVSRLFSHFSTLLALIFPVICRRLRRKDHIFQPGNCVSAGHHTSCRQCSGVGERGSRRPLAPMGLASSPPPLSVQRGPTVQPPLHPALFHSNSRDAHCTPACLCLNRSDWKRRGGMKPKRNIREIPRFPNPGPSFRFFSFSVIPTGLPPLTSNPPQTSTSSPLRS